MVTKEQLSTKNIEELIVIFFSKMSYIFHYLIQIAEIIHTEEIKAKELQELKNKNQKPLLNGIITKNHIKEYFSFMFNYNSFSWAIRQINSFTTEIKAGKIITKELYKLVDIRNNLAHGGFCYEDNDFNGERLGFYREKFDIKKQQFENVLKGNGRETLIDNILKSEKLCIVIGLISMQLKANETLEYIFGEYFDNKLTIIKKPLRFTK